MNHQEASLIVRQHIALVDEGIGPKNIQPEDEALMRDAVRAVRAQDRLRGHVRDTLGDHTLWDFGLLTDAEHKAIGCSCGMTDDDGPDPEGVEE